MKYILFAISFILDCSTYLYFNLSSLKIINKKIKKQRAIVEKILILLLLKNIKLKKMDIKNNLRKFDLSPIIKLIIKNIANKVVNINLFLL